MDDVAQRMYDDGFITRDQLRDQLHDETDIMGIAAQWTIGRTRTERKS